MELVDENGQRFFHPKLVAHNQKNEVSYLILYSLGFHYIIIL